MIVSLRECDGCSFGGACVGRREDEMKLLRLLRESFPKSLRLAPSPIVQRGRQASLNDVSGVTILRLGVSTRICKCWGFLPFRHDVQK